MFYSGNKDRLNRKDVSLCKDSVLNKGKDKKTLRGKD